jgi:hypothetical protein
MTVLDNIVRASNALVLILGLTLVSYGGYVISVCKLNTAAEAALALGVLDLCLGVVAISCYRSLFVLRLYGLVMSFLVIAEFVLAILFLTNSPSVTGLTTCSDDKALDFAKTASAVSWIILAVAVFQSVSLIFVFFQVCSVDKVRAPLRRAGGGEGWGGGGWVPWGGQGWGGGREQQARRTPPFWGHHRMHSPSHARKHSCTRCSPLTRASTRRRSSWASPPRRTSTALCPMKASPRRRTGTSKSTPAFTPSMG